MMSLLRQHFESLQQKHQHVNDITGGIVGSSLKGGFLGNINKARKAVQGSIQDIKVSFLMFKFEMLMEGSCC